MVGGGGRKGRELARKGERGGKGRGRKGEEGERGGRRKKSRNRGEKGRREQILTRRLTHSQTMAEPTRSDLITDLWCEEPAKGTQGNNAGSNQKKINPLCSSYGGMMSKNIVLLMTKASLY